MKLILIVIIILAVGFYLPQILERGRGLSEMEARQKNAEFCAEMIIGGGVDDRYVEITELEECYDFYLNTPIKELVK